jgi:hypothetical protein
VDYEDSRQLGSNTAKQGFQNERDVVLRFNQWSADDTAKSWLGLLGHCLEKVESVSAVLITGSHKADISVEVSEKNCGTRFLHFIQVKLVSNLRGYNQIDKRWVDRYCELWSIPSDIVKLLKLYTGESKPTRSGRDPRRMFADEFKNKDQHQLKMFFDDYKNQILKTIFSGEGNSAAQWLLVVQKIDRNPAWALWPIDRVIKFFGDGDIIITKQGNIRIGKVTVQRKGGDGGRKTAKMLQFKINPAAIL